MEAKPAWWAARPWLAAALLYTPMAAVLLLPLAFHPPGQIPTGFVQYDQIEYMALAREYFDHGFQPLFGLPFSDDPATPRIYFQPWSLGLGLIREVTAFDPGHIYLAFGLVSGLLCVRVIVALWSRVGGREGTAAGVGLLLFTWGGGLFFLGGLAAALLGEGFDLRALWRFDPAGGLWFLNLGRNLFYSVEAFYHLLSLGVLLALVRGRHGLAVALLALLSASHPFTGAQYLAIVLAWSLLERLLQRGSQPSWFPLAVGALTALHAGYYLLALPALSPEHAGLERRWTEAPEVWFLSLEAQALGYALVLLPALVAVRRGALARPVPRLFALVALVSLALANHELFMPPQQPLHFTRGHLWTGLFLLGAPVLVGWLSRPSRPLRGPVFAGVALLFLADNGVWLGQQLRNNMLGAGYAMELRPAERALLERLDEPHRRGALLVAEDELIPYFATAYTALRAWYSQLLLTPDAEQRAADIAAWRDRGIEPPSWRAREMLFVVRDDGRDPADFPWVTADSRIERIDGFLLVTRPPQAARD